MAKDWKKSVFIPIPKKSNAKECSYYHTFVLISHASKIMLALLMLALIINNASKILQARLQQYMNWTFSYVQAGFWRDRGTSDQIANILWIIEKVGELLKYTYFYFIDYTKAFHCVEHSKLENLEVPDHHTYLPRYLFAGQEATAGIRHEATDWFQIGRGVRQGCKFSPCSLNLHSECMHAC